MAEEPIVAQTSPYQVDLVEGQTYWYCRCGRSKSQPFCDGSHEGTGLEPLEFTAPSTGTFNLWMRGVRFASFAQPEWRASPFGQAVLLKLATFALVLVLSAVHDFAIGPRATRALERDPRGMQAVALRRRASLLGRANVLLALVLVAAGVVIVRGWPW